MTNTPSDAPPALRSNVASSRRVWVSLDKAASYFGCSKRSLEKHVAARDIPTCRVGRVLRVDLLGAEAVFMSE